MPSSAYVRLLVTPSRAYAMGMPAQNLRWTAEMVRTLPDDGKRYELVDGELLVSPAPSYLHTLLMECDRSLRILSQYYRDPVDGAPHAASCDAFNFECETHRRRHTLECRASIVESVLVAKFGSPVGLRITIPFHNPGWESASTLIGYVSALWPYR